MIDKQSEPIDKQPIDEQSESTDEPEKKSGSRRAHLAREIIETIALTLLIFLVIRFAVQSYRVENISMQPSFYSNEYVLVNKTAYLFHDPERGDVVVFHFPLDTSRDFIKRVIGIPGDVIKIDNRNVWVNDVELKEPYISAQPNPNVPLNPSANTWKVGPGEYFVMGDNRPASDDSRIWGFVPRSYIVGKAVLVYWPIKNWRVIDTYPAVFAQIKPNH